jgi:hypothetical protein
MHISHHLDKVLHTKGHTRWRLLTTMGGFFTFAWFSKQEVTLYYGQPGTINPHGRIHNLLPLFLKP